MSEPLPLRDMLALDRTRLANERTALAYIRTVLALVAGGVTLMTLFDNRAAQAAGWALIGLGLVATGFGVSRVWRVRRHLQEAERHASNGP